MSDYEKEENAYRQGYSDAIMGHTSTCTGYETEYNAGYRDGIADR